MGAGATGVRFMLAPFHAISHGGGSFAMRATRENV